jgi:hypothetical protein
MRMSTARLWRALHGIGGRNRDDMFIHMVIVHVVEMAIMEIVDVAVMVDCCMPAVGTMLVSMVRMMFFGAGGHGVLPFWLRFEAMAVIAFRQHAPWRLQSTAERDCESE